MSLYSIFILKVVCGNSLEVQWLGLHPSMAKGKEFNPWSGHSKENKKTNKYINHFINILVFETWNKQGHCKVD